MTSTPTTHTFHPHIFLPTSCPVYSPSFVTVLYRSYYREQKIKTNDKKNIFSTCLPPSIHPSIHCSISLLTPPPSLSHQLSLLTAAAVWGLKSACGWGEGAEGFWGFLGMNEVVWTCDTCRGGCCCCWFTQSTPTPPLLKTQADTRTHICTYLHTTKPHGTAL